MLVIVILHKSYDTEYVPVEIAICQVCCRSGRPSSVDKVILSLKDGPETPLVDLMTEMNTCRTLAYIGKEKNDTLYMFSKLLLHQYSTVVSLHERERREGFLRCLVYDDGTWFLCVKIMRRKQLTNKGQPNRKVTNHLCSSWRNCHGLILFKRLPETKSQYTI